VLKLSRRYWLHFALAICGLLLSASEEGDFADEQDAEIKKLPQMQEASQNIIKEREKTIVDLNAKLLAYEDKIANINKTFQIGIGVAAACAGVGVLFFKSFVGRNNSLTEQITQQATSTFQF
jgi:glutamine amidotransferase PdxT